MPIHDAQMSRLRMQGFSLVELMVGMVVSLIGTLAIMAAFAVYEGHKRTTTSGNDAQQNGSFSVYQMERQIRSAGSGIVQGFNYSVWGCGITAVTNSKQQLPATGALPAPFTNWPVAMLAMPVLIQDGGSTKGGGINPDVISVISGNSAYQVFKVGVTSTPSVSSVVVGNAFGIQASDYLLGVLPDGSCALSQAASITSNTNIALVTANSPTTGLNNAVNLFDLGPQPTFNLFGVDMNSNSLVSYDLLQRPINANAPSVVPIADGIVQLKALYGVHTGTGAAGESANQVDEWVQATGAWSLANLTAGTAAAQSAMKNIKAIRIAVIAQSRLPERSSDYNGPATLTLFPDLSAQGLSYDIPVQTQYRYKIYDTTIPVRNALINNYF
jgi:type IV pilus assembly protein PilW